MIGGLISFWRIWCDCEGGGIVDRILVFVIFIMVGNKFKLIIVLLIDRFDY